MRILVTGALSDPENNIPRIEAKGHSVSFLHYEWESLPCPAEEIEGVVCNSLFLHHPIEAFTNLKYIQLVTAGYDRQPMEYIREHGIEFHNASGVYSIPMAEQALCGVLMLYRNMDFYREKRLEKSWQKLRRRPELFEKTVGIFGCGSVGKTVAERFKGFGCHIIGFRRHIPDENTHQTGEVFDQIEALSSADKYLPELDIVVAAMPLNNESRDYFSQERIGMMKSDAVFVNVARGAEVDEKALIKALDEKRLLGAVLDVFEQEPLPKESPLWNMENVILTPHVSFAGERNEERLMDIVLGNLPVG